MSIDDIGSQIAFAFNSNAYLESLSRMNYMGLESKVINTFGETKGLQEITLTGVHDVFNCEPMNKAGLEAEMVVIGKVEWVKLKFNTHSKDIGFKIRRGGKKDIDLPQSSFNFKTATSA